MLGMAAPNVIYGMLTELLTLRPGLEALGSMVWHWQRVSVSVVCELTISITLRLCFLWESTSYADRNGYIDADRFAW